MTFWVVYTAKRYRLHTHYPPTFILGFFGISYLDLVIFVSMPTQLRQLCSSKLESQIVDASPDDVGQRDALKTVRGSRANNPPPDGRDDLERSRRKTVKVPPYDWAVSSRAQSRERRVRTLQVPAPRWRPSNGESGWMENSLECERVATPMRQENGKPLPTADVYSDEWCRPAAENSSAVSTRAQWENENEKKLFNW